MESEGAKATWTDLWYNGNMYNRPFLDELPSERTYDKEKLCGDYFTQLESKSNFALQLLRDIFQNEEKISLHESLVFFRSQNEEHSSPGNEKRNKRIEHRQANDIKPREEVKHYSQNRTETPKRKRKSKFSDIHEYGDLSFVGRESKRRYRNMISTSKTKMKGKSDVPCSSAGSSKSSCLRKDDDVDKFELQLVHYLMHTLKHPKTKYHQDCVLQILRSDQKLLRAFLRENNTKLCEKIPVFRKRNIGPRNEEEFNQGRFSLDQYHFKNNEENSFLDWAHNSPRVEGTDRILDDENILYENARETTNPCQNNGIISDNTTCPIQEEARTAELVYRENVQYMLQNTTESHFQSSLQNNSEDFSYPFCHAPFTPYVPTTFTPCVSPFFTSSDINAWDFG